MDRARPHPLLLRVVSALVLAPVAVTAVWLQGRYLAALLLVGAAAMGWEWARLSGRGGLKAPALVIVVTELAAVLAVAAGSASWAPWIALAGAGLVLLAGISAGGVEPLWAAGGTLWIAVGTIGFFWLAADLEVGRATALWLLALVWANDTAAYAAGKLVGGPRLAPRVSPNKTWAGFCGGLLGAAAMGVLASALVGIGSWVLVPVSMILAAIAQVGDLAESFAKRHFGVKDSSDLIPGHGGVLDRVDGLLAAAAAAALMTLAAGGSPLTWR